MNSNQNFTDKLPDSSFDIIRGLVDRPYIRTYDSVPFVVGKLFGVFTVTDIEIIRVHDLFKIPKLLRREGRA